MSYNVEQLPKFVSTAGKISILTALTGLLVFVLAFLFNAGTNELMKADATSTASTTLTVLNTPPQWTTLAFEEIESSTTTPTNSGTSISWIGVANDSNNQPYFLIVCSGSATPTPAAASGYGNLGSAPPSCAPTSTLWAVSASTTSGATARAATTTTESYSELNNWYAWVCDDDPVNPRCNYTASQGLSATNSSPFHVNHRPVFTAYSNNSPADPSATITFYSTSSDPDVVGGEDTIVLHVCNDNDFSTTTRSCGPGGYIASTSPAVLVDASATYTLPSVIQDQVYDGYGFIIDQHGHVASGGAQGSNPGFTVNNVAPTVAGGAIILNGGTDISLTNPAGQTTGYTLRFEISDANSCINAASSSEITGHVVTVQRSDIATTTCNGTAGAYNPNNCYTSGVATSTWNLSCTASSTSCTSAIDPTQVFDCTFPLWFLTDPTDSSSPFDTASWTAAVAGVDDDNATGSLRLGTNYVDVLTFPALDLLTAEIPYGALEPGSNSGTLTASTTVTAVGNAGLDQSLSGESMCTTFSVSTECPVSATSTVAENNQRFATSSVSYASGVALSSTTPYELEINVMKSTSTTVYAEGRTYWGISVPGTITLAGAYTGLNTFIAVVSEPGEW